LLGRTKLKVGSTKLEVGSRESVGSSEPLGSVVNVANEGLAVGIGDGLAVGWTNGGSVGVSDATESGGCVGLAGGADR
jgi:hypothetical protein